MHISRRHRKSSLEHVVTGLLLVTSTLFLAPPSALGESEGDASTGTPPGRIEFVGRNTFFTANGVFHKWRIVTNRATFNEFETGDVVVEISVASLDTDNQRRDDHLRSTDFLEVERWPMARVHIHNVSQKASVHYQADFEVQIRGIVKTIRGEFEVITRSPLTVRGTLTIDRTDFGIGDPKTWNPMSIENEIPVAFEATLSS